MRRYPKWVGSWKAGGSDRVGLQARYSHEEDEHFAPLEVS
jgi:hypothetical protein